MPTNFAIYSDLLPISYTMSILFGSNSDAYVLRVLISYHAIGKHANYLF